MSLSLSILFAAPGCGRDPNNMYAHLLERAASWASSVQFTSELAQDGQQIIT
jgi:hypothetical protein